MNFTVKNYTKAYNWVKNGDLYQCIDDIDVLLQDNHGLNYHFHLYPGFRTDGGSVPKPFQCVIPSWDKSNELLNLAYALHDYCYGSEVLSKSDSDDLVRGMLRDSGMSRVKAGMVHMAVYRFAGNHYGIEHDKWDCALFGTMRKYLPHE